MEAAMTYDPDINGLRRDNPDRGPSPMGALAFMIAVLVLMGGAAFLFSGRSDNDVASNLSAGGNPMHQGETTGNATPSR
jgi:hypothetical protein